MSQLVLIKENKIVAFLRDISRPIRLFISFTLLSVLFLFWAVFLYVPTNSKVQQFKTDIETLKISKQQSLRLISKLPALELKNKELLKKFNVGSYSYKECVDNILGFVHKNGLKCKKFIPSNNKFELVVNGEYQGVIKLLRDIKESHFDIKVSNFSLISSGDGVELKMHLNVKV